MLAAVPTALRGPAGPLQRMNETYARRRDLVVALFLHGFPLSSFQWRGALDRDW